MDLVFFPTIISTSKRPILADNEIIYTKAQDLQLFYGTKMMKYKTIFVTSHRIVFIKSLIGEDNENFEIRNSFIHSHSLKVFLLNKDWIFKS
jgi:hypothetical protein